jgi:predicted RNase H-like HicB family nuclease
MKSIKYCIYQEEPYYVAQCLNVEVSSFGDTVEEALANLKEAVELYFEDEESPVFMAIGDVMIGESRIGA